MKQTELTRAIQEEIKLELDVADEVIQEELEPMNKAWNPEDESNLGPYKNWGPREIMSLYLAYGIKDADAFIAKKEFERMKAEEAQEV